MSRLRFAIVLGAWLLLAQVSPAAEPPLATLTGVVSKATPNVLMVKPRGPEGRFNPTMVLKLRGTSKVFTVGTQTRRGQTVVVQRETSPGDLGENQVIVAIYTVVKDENILLTAVVQPGGR